MDKTELMQTTVTLERRQVERLRQLAGREYLAAGPGTGGHGGEKPSVSKHVRRALDKYLEAKA